MVVQFVAFLGAYRNPGALDPWVAAVLGALLTTWVTFVPVLPVHLPRRARTSSGCAATARCPPR